MRMMMTIKLPAEHGNKAMRDGSAKKAFQSLFDRIKPEAAYFTVEDGYRAAIFVYDLKAEYELLEIHEPLFAAMGALIYERPVLTWDDMERAMGAMKP